jgi:hypothetical protein
MAPGKVFSVLDSCDCKPVRKKDAKKTKPNWGGRHEEGMGCGGDGVGEGMKVVDK